MLIYIFPLFGLSLYLLGGLLGHMQGSRYNSRLGFEILALMSGLLFSEGKFMGFGAILVWEFVRYVGIAFASVAVVAGFPLCVPFVSLARILHPLLPLYGNLWRYPFCKWHERAT